MDRRQLFVNQILDQYCPEPLENLLLRRSNEPLEQQRIIFIAWRTIIFFSDSEDNQSDSSSLPGSDEVPPLVSITPEPNIRLSPRSVVRQLGRRCMFSQFYPWWDRFRRQMPERVELTSQSDEESARDDSESSSVTVSEASEEDLEELVLPMESLSASEIWERNQMMNFLHGVD